MKSKKELRAELRAKRLSIDNKEEKNSAILSNILAMPKVQTAESLFIFYPLEGEINLLPLVNYAKENGKSIAFPLCTDKNGNMHFCETRSLDELECGSFGIREPRADAPEKFPENAVIFLPALAIDKTGYRLGYGKGYYDRYLAKYANLNPYTVGVIYKDLIFDELPHDEYDVPCDAVVCESGVMIESAG